MGAIQATSVAEGFRRPIDNSPQDLGTLSTPIGRVTLTAAPRFYQDHERFGCSPFDVMLEGGTVKVKQVGEVDVDDIRIVMRHAHTMVPYESIGSYIYGWQRRLSAGFPEFKGTVEVSQDDTHILLTRRFRGWVKDSTLSRIFQEVHRPEGLIVDFSNNPLLFSSTLTLKFDRVVLKRWGDSLRRFESESQMIAGTLTAILNERQFEGVRGETRRTALQEIIYGLLSEDAEDRVAAAAALRCAPQRVAKQAAEAFLKLGEEHSLARSGNYDLSQSPSGLPCSAHEDFYTYFVVPLRLEGIRIAAMAGLVEYAPRLFTLVDQSRYADTPRSNNYSDGFKNALAEQRAAAAEALGIFARSKPEILEKLLELAACGTSAPWWVKEAAITALGFTCSQDPRLEEVILEAAICPPSYLNSVHLVRDNSVRNDQFIAEVLRAAAMKAAARLRHSKALEIICSSLPHDAPTAVSSRQASPDSKAALRALHILGGAEAIAKLSAVAENSSSHWVHRKEALEGLAILAPKDHKTLSALMAAYFQLVDPTEAQRLVLPLGNLRDNVAFTTWWNSLVSTITEDLRVGSLDSQCLRNAALELLTKVPCTGLLQMLSRIEREPGRPEWKVNLGALEHLLTIDPDNARAAQRAIELWSSIDRYSWHATSYISREDLCAFARVMKLIEEREPQMIRGATRPKHLLDSTFRDVVRRELLKTLSDSEMF